MKRTIPGPYTGQCRYYCRYYCHLLKSAVPKLVQAQQSGAYKPKLVYSDTIPNKLRPQGGKPK